MPPFHVIGMGLETGSRLVKLVIEFQIQMVCLQIHEYEDRRDRARELAKGVKDVLSLEGNAFPELLGVHLGR